MKKIILLMTLLLVTSLRIHAITGGFIPDGASLEAMIGNHRVVGAVLDARVIAEIGVRLAHDTLRSEVKDYKEVSNELDKYYRCLDIVDLIFKGSATAIHHVTAYKTIKEELKDYKDLIASYEKNILLKGALWTTDTTVLFTTQRCVLSVMDEAEELYKSYGELVTLITGISSCKTSDLMTCLTDINDHLNNITDVIRQSHYYLLGYMTMRLGYNKRELLAAGDFNDIIRNVCHYAYIRWQETAKAAARHNTSKSGAPIEKKYQMGNGGLIGAIYERENTYIFYNHYSYDEIYDTNIPLLSHAVFSHDITEPCSGLC